MTTTANPAPTVEAAAPAVLSPLSPWMRETAQNVADAIRGERMPICRHGADPILENGGVVALWLDTVLCIECAQVAMLQRAVMPVSACDRCGADCPDVDLQVCLAQPWPIDMALMFQLCRACLSAQEQGAQEVTL